MLPVSASPVILPGCRERPLSDALNPAHSDCCYPFAPFDFLIPLIDSSVGSSRLALADVAAGVPPFALPVWCVKLVPAPTSGPS